MEEGRIPGPILEDFRRAVSERSLRRGLTTNADKIAYFQDYLLPYLREKGGRVLYVGVGHGLDAVYALLSGVVKDAVGVDPYRSGHGNDEEDYRNLKEMIGRYGLGERFILWRGTIQEYLAGSAEKHTAIVSIDVLHHIFLTRGSFRRSPLFDEAVSLFESLSGHTEEGGLLFIQEAERWGFRQILKKVGLLSGSVNYGTKHSWRQWREAAVRGGYSFLDKRVYVPWVLRGWRKWLDNRVGQHTISDRSVTIYEKQGPAGRFR